MNSMLTYRNDLKQILIEHKDINNKLEVDNSYISEIENSLKSGELIISVVGEIKTGKSTFLNALLEHKIFPSRATVCTAGVTILDNGEKAEAKIIYRDGTQQDININGDNTAEILSNYISRKNENVKNINLLKIKYPNKFTGNGILLVDTPGVNDPESWREEITYNYLSSSDAILMILDATKPLSSSEIEFLRDKVLTTNINQFIFIINKIDFIPMEDREKISDRIRQGLNKYIPNPQIFTLSSQTALDMRLAGDREIDNSSGFNNFEDELLNFLAKGRGGKLLKTKINKGLYFINDLEKNIDKRIMALDSEKNDVKKELNNANQELKKIKSDKSKLQKEILNEKNKTTNNLKKIISEYEDDFSNSLKNQLIKEPDITILHNKINRFQKETIEKFENRIKAINKELSKKYKKKSSDIITNVDDILSSLQGSAASEIQDIKIGEKIKETKSKIEFSDLKDGSYIGGAVGGIAATTIASNIVTLTAAGAVVPFFSIPAVIGLGIAGLMAGGLAGAGASEVMKRKKIKENPESFIETKTIINNTDAINSIQKFLNNLQLRTKDLSYSIISIFKEDLINPIDIKIKNQEKLINSIKTDAEKTDVEQKSLRQDLKDRIKEINTLKNKYSTLDSKVSNL